MDVKIVTKGHRGKKSYMHFCVQDNVDKEHYLIGSEAWHVPATPTGTHPTARAGLASKRLPHDLHYGTTMIPVNYSEKICIGSGGPRMDQSCYSYCEWEAPRRDKVTIEVTPTLRPSLYREKIICHRNCTKRNYNSTTFYKPALQQRHRAETVYLPPKCHVTKYSSAVDYHSKAEPRWYTNTLEVKPTTYSNSLVHKFGYYGTRLESEVTEDVASRPSSPVSSDEGFDQGEFCLESPHSLDSLGGSSRDSSPPREESYRSKLVVNGYTPGSLTTLDDYLSDASNDDVTEV